MRDFRDSKAMAQSLRQALTEKSVTLSHSESLELIARSFGFDNWNILAAKIAAEKPAVQPEPAKSDSNLHCSFCGKSQHVVQKLIAGPTVFICDACVGLCDGIILEGEIGRQLLAARSRRPGADPLETARDAFRDLSDERLTIWHQLLAKRAEPEQRAGEGESAAELVARVLAERVAGPPEPRPAG